MTARSEKDTATNILRAASRLFAERGFANVSIRDVCKESDTTAPVIYYHFGSKKGLFEAVIGERVSMRDLIAKLTGIADANNPEKSIGSFVKTYLTFFPENAFVPGLYLRESASLDRRSAEIISGDLDKIRTIAVSLIEACIRKRNFRRTDAGLAADCLLGMLNKVIFQGIHFSKASDKETYGRFVTDFFIRAMK